MSHAVLIVGAFHEVIELCHVCGVTVRGVFDRQRQGTYMGITILGDDDMAVRNAKMYSDTPVIVCPDMPVMRRTLVERYAEAGYEFHALISPRSDVSPSASVGTGVLIQSGCRVSSMARLGDFVRVNTCANITHDVIVGNFATIAPNAVILGGVKIGEAAYVGANSTILPGRCVGAGAVVAQGPW
jgi:sugar O-acyltransferase (sialic acid O-acetyltransferase NeuD family)